MAPKTSHKRKRDPDNASKREMDDATLVKTLSSKLHHGLKEAKQATKKAKAFELRRAIKRLKDIKKKADQSKSVTEIESELELLKALDHDRLAHIALYKKLQKDHFLSHHPLVQQAVSSALPPPSESEKASNPIQNRVESRVLSSKTLANELKAILDHLKNVVEPPVSAKAGTAEIDEDEEEQTEVARRKVADSDEEEDQDDDDNAEDDDEGDDTGEIDASAVLARALGLGAGSGSDSGDNDDSSDSDSASEPPTSHDVDDDGWESGSVNSAPTSPRPTKRVKTSHPASGTDSDSEADDDKGERVGSHFLPSLNVGFTRGDGKDDWSGDEDDVDVGDEPVRKNRRGQRARKAIWEKKYGKNANHVKKQQEEERALQEAQALRARTKGRPTRGNGPNRGGGDGGIPTKLDAGWGGMKAKAKGGPSGGAVGSGKGGAAKAKVKEEQLHPSWEAKRKLKEKEKEMMSAGVSGSLSMGKKIKFT